MSERPFSCEQCGKKFKTRHCVNIHLRSHGIGGYSWCCEECGKTFNQISAYHVHLKVHSNIREFACEDCGMTFKLKHSLKKHQLVHKAEFGHTCDYCGKKFKASWTELISWWNILISLVMTYCYYSAQTTWSTTDDATQGSTLTSVTGATGRGRTAPPLSTTRRSTTSPWTIWGQSARAAAIQNQCCSPGRNHQKTVFFHQIVCVQPHISEPARAETKHPHADTPGAQTPTGGCQVPMQLSIQATQDIKF